MPYLNVDDNYPEHPKVDALSDGAFRLHTAAMCHSAKYLTDGLIETRRIARLSPTYKPAYVTELQKAGLWEPTPGGFLIHDYLDWNKPRSWWEAKRERDAQRKAKWRAENGGRDEGGTP